MAKKSVGISILTLKMIIERKYKRLISSIQSEIKGIEQGRQGEAHLQLHTQYSKENEGLGLPNPPQNRSPPFTITKMP